MVETKGLTLEEIAVKFDGESSALAQDIGRKVENAELEKAAYMEDDTKMVPDLV